MWWFMVQWLSYTAGVYVASELVPGITLKGRAAPLVVGGMLGVANLALAKLLFVVLSVATLGLAWLFGFITRWIIAAVLFKAVDVATDRLTVNGLLPALLGGGVVSVVVSVVTWLVPGAR